MTKRTRAYRSPLLRLWAGLAGFVEWPPVDASRLVVSCLFLLALVLSLLPWSLDYVWRVLGIACVVVLALLWVAAWAFLDRREKGSAFNLLILWAAAYWPVSALLGALGIPGRPVSLYSVVAIPVLIWLRAWSRGSSA